MGAELLIDEMCALLLVIRLDPTIDQEFGGLRGDRRRDAVGLGKEERRMEKADERLGRLLDDGLDCDDKRGEVGVLQ